MAVDEWLASFGSPISGSTLSNPQAARLVDFVDRHTGAVATFFGARRRCDQELVVLDVRTGAPQAPVHPIRRTERLGILFDREGAMPLVAMQNLGSARSERTPRSRGQSQRRRCGLTGTFLLLPRCVQPFTGFKETIRVGFRRNPNPTRPDPSYPKHDKAYADCTGHCPVQLDVANSRPSTSNA